MSYREKSQELRVQAYRIGTKIAQLEKERRAVEEAAKVLDALHASGMTLDELARKARPSWLPVGLPSAPPAGLPDTLPIGNEPQFMPKCGCLVGSVCLNAACPHRLVTTCEARETLTNDKPYNGPY